MRIILGLVLLSIIISGASFASASIRDAARQAAEVDRVKAARWQEERRQAVARHFEMESRYAPGHHSMAEWWNARGQEAIQIERDILAQWKIEEGHSIFSGTGMALMEKAWIAKYSQMYPGSNFNPVRGHGLLVLNNGLLKVFAQDGQIITMEALDGVITEKISFPDSLCTVSDGKNSITLQLSDDMTEARFIDATMPDMAEESYTMLDRAGIGVGVRRNATIKILNDVYHQAVAAEETSMIQFASEVLTDGRVRGWALQTAEEIYRVRH